MSGVSVSPATASVNVDATVELTATVNPSNATDKNVTWTSSDIAKATVSDGTVTGKAAGSVTITATAGGKSGTCAVTVNAPSQP